jgi:hypothetical protein
MNLSSVTNMLYLSFDVKCIPLQRLPSSGMLRRVALVRPDVSEERISSIITLTRIGELGTNVSSISSQRASLASYC